MALKGTTRIELTNVKTGQKEVIEKNNLVTNAVPSALENPFAWQLKTPHGSKWFSGNMLPMCPNLFGGILLYENAIPENVDQLYAQPDNKLIGYSSNNVNDKADIMRGSMNQNESGALEDGSGYRFVFDFTTAQANGTISALGLTSKWGGMAGYGSTEWKDTQSPKVWSQVTGGNENKIWEMWAYANAVHYNEETGVVTSAYVSGQKEITINRIQLHTKKWKICNSMNMADYAQVQLAEILETSVFAGASTADAHRYVAFCDSGDGYIWGFEHANNAAGNSSGKASINWVKIKVDDLTFNEGTWEIDAQIFQFGYVYATPGERANRTTQTCNAVILEGYLYCLSYTRAGLYKINLSNVTDVLYIRHPAGFVAYPSYAAAGTRVYPHYGTATLTISGNKVCMWNGYLNKDTIVPHNYNISTNADLGEELNDGWITANAYYYPKRQCIGMHALKMGAFLFGFNVAEDVYGHMLLDSPYLATINNLPAPVQKTADKTMKITYILREES